MLEKLFSPMKIGKMEIANRMVVPPMVTNYCNKDGTATEKFIAYLEAKAKGGWGLIITEDYAVDPSGKGFSCVPGLWDDSQIPSHSGLTKRIHQYKSKIFAQIYHCGRQTSSLVAMCQPLAPSPIPCPAMQELPDELTVEKIEALVEKFGDCALRAKKAGFDGVEIHGAHGYLIAQFMSPYSNKRTDKYGGHLLNRVRFPLDIVANVRAKAGKDFGVGFRISGDEFVPGGRSIEDTKAIAILLEQAGIDYLHVSCGVYGSADKIIPPSSVPHGWLAGHAEEVKRVVGIPVITVGRINDPFVADSIIAAGKADFVAMGRASLADPDLPAKAAAGQFDRIRPCVACNEGCIGLLFQDQAIKCVLNPTLGREAEPAAKPPATKKKVVVIGGGPAGMEAAATAAKAGHEAILLEKQNRLGGLYYLASVPPNKGEIGNFVGWQIDRLKDLNVRVDLNAKVTPELIDSHKPDVVILATGGTPVMPEIPGVDKPNVANAYDVLAGKIAVGPRALIIGGGMVGAETANHLANHGKAVTLVEMLPDIATEIPNINRMALLQDLEKGKVKILVNTTVKDILTDGAVVVKDCTTETLSADTVIVASGSKPDGGLEAQLAGKPYKVITIGDAKKVRKVMEAIEEGYLAGTQV
jgi:2,4-dienoyl-CoA reductase-like NADH-dependent reductase (Old Yellow Enzyme family)/thioredoxin reductase